MRHNSQKPIKTRFLGFYAIGLTHWSSETGFLPEYASQLPETHKNPVSKIPNRKSKIENPKSS